MKKLKKYEYLGIYNIPIISVMLAIALLFVRSNNIFLKAFLPLQSSIFETGKLLYISILLYSIYEYFAFGKRFKNFFFAKLASIFLAPYIYIYSTYFLDSLIGSSMLLGHVFTFFIAVSVGQYISTLFLTQLKPFPFLKTFSIISLVLLYSIYASHSLKTPNSKSINEYEKVIANKKVKNYFKTSFHSVNNYF